jgi:tape measure domain-containing protein
VADPKIKFDIEANATGGAGVDQLATSLERLDTSIDPKLAAVAGDLAAELRKLGAQRAAVEQLTDLRNSTQGTAKALELARNEVVEFGIGMAATAEPTRAQVGQMAKLNAALEASEKAHGKNLVILKKEETALREAGVQTDRLQSAQVNLAQQTARAVETGRGLIQTYQLQAEAARQFEVLGVRSASAIRAELVATRAAAAAVAASGDLMGSGLAAAAAKAAPKISALERELRLATGQLTLMDKASLSLSGLAGRANGLISKFGALGAAVAAAGYAFKPFVEATAALDRWRRSLTTATGSVQEARQQIETLRDVAQRTGGSVEDTADAFVKFTTSLRLSGFSAAETNRVYEAVSQAAGRMGLSGERTSLVFDALGQMAAKGTVSMEELRQQLGDSLPGALSLMAKSLGITEQQLIKLVESGQLLTRDALGPLAEALAKVGAQGGQDMDGLTQRWNRFKNVVYEAYQVIGESGPVKAAGTVVAGLGKAVEYVAFVLTFLGESFTVVGGQIGVAMADIANQGLKFRGFSDDAKQAFQEIEDASTAKLTGLVARMNGIRTAGDSAAQGLNTVGAAAQGAGQQAQAGVAGVEANAQAHGAAATAAAGNATAQGRAGSAAAASGAQASAASAAWVKLGVDYAQVNAATAQAVVVSEAVAKAKRLEGQAREAVAKLAGDEFAALQAGALAATAEAAALADVAEKRRTQVEVLRADVAARQALIATLGDADGARARQIASITQNIEKLDAEAVGARASADASRTDADAKNLAASVYGDNSEALDALRVAYEQSVVAVQAVTVAKRAGLATDDDMAQAARRAAIAQALYRDAVDDTAKAFDRKRSAIDRTLQLTQGSLQLDQERLRTEEKYAASVGDTAGVLRAQIGQKEIDLRLTQAKVDALKQESAGLIAVATAQLAALNSNDPLLEQKREEIQARITNAKLMQTEAERLGEVSKQIQNEIENLRKRGNAGAQSSQAIVNGLEAEIRQREQANELAQRSIDLENKRKGVDRSGFAINQQTGETINAGGATLLSLINDLKSYGLDDAKAQAVAREFVDGKGDVPYFNNPGQNKYGASTLSQAVQRAAQESLYGKDGKGGSQAAQTTTNSASANGQTYRVVIDLQGRSTAVNLASQSDAQTLVSLIKTLQTEAGRSA